MDKIIQIDKLSKDLKGQEILSDLSLKEEIIHSKPFLSVKIIY